VNAPAGDDTVGNDDTVIKAAGALPWSRGGGDLQVALVHRPRYDDWSWAKGKLDPGEEWPAAAAREVFEETGLHVRLGRPLPPSAYTVQNGAGSRLAKEVRYWAAEVIGGDGTLVHEIDEVVWLDVAAAGARLSYPRDQDQLRALVRFDREERLDTWPLVVVRHGRSLPRQKWHDEDPLRPLDARGRERAEALVPILAGYGVTRVVSSPSKRCLDTVLPYAVAAGTRVRLHNGLSEEGFAKGPGRAPRHLSRLLERGTGAVVCSHGPVLPALFDQLGVLAGEPAAKSALSEAAQHGLGKGEALVAHLAGTGAQARVVDVERYAA